RRQPRQRADPCVRLQRRVHAVALVTDPDRCVDRLVGRSAHRRRSPPRSLMALPAIIDALAALPAFQTVASELPAPGTRKTVGGLVGSSDAVLVSAVAQAFP